MTTEEVKVRPEFNVEQWEAWVSTRPEMIQEMCRRHPAKYLYRMEPTGKIVNIYSYGENGRVTVIVSGKYNLVDFESHVLDVNPDSLTPCNAPGPDVTVGVLDSGFPAHGYKLLISKEALSELESQLKEEDKHSED